MTIAGSILVVDDEATIRQTLASILQQERFEVTTAESGEQALAFLETSEFDAIYLDIRMPGMSGLDVLEKVHASHPDIPVILFTAQPDLNSAVEALRRGAADYLPKPLKPAALIAKTHAILALRLRERRKREIKAQIEGLQAELKSIESEEVEHPAQRQAPPANNRFLKRGNLVLDLHARRLIIGEEVMNLRPTSFDYLLVLARHAPEVVDYQTLVAEALGYQAEAREAQELVKWHIHDIRQAIEPDVHHPVYLLNARGIGYRLVAE
jgi:DNA-binding response OmpR family regulator